MPDIELATASRFADRVRRRVASFAWHDIDKRLAVTISLGVARGGADGWRSVIAAAHAALYAAKRRGRNRVASPAPRSERTAS